MFDFIGKIGEMKQKVSEVKQSLETMEVYGEAGDGAVRVVLTASKSLKDIVISPELMKAEERQRLEDLLAIAFRSAMQQADEVAKDRLKSATDGLLPNIPGIFD